MTDIATSPPALALAARVSIGRTLSLSFATFGHAAALSGGRRWRMPGLLLLHGVLIITLGALLLAIETFAADAPVLAVIVMVPFSALYSIVGAILPVVVYYLLRSEKEGIGMDDIAKVFD